MVRGPRLKCCKKFAKADLIWVFFFYKGTKRHPQRGSVIPPAFGRRTVLNWPIFSTRHSQKCFEKQNKDQVCVFVWGLKITFCKAATSPVWIFWKKKEKSAIKQWPAHGRCGHMTVPWAFQSRRSWASGSAADVVIIACISSCRRNPATWSMANFHFHHHLKLCRQVEELHSSAHMWWMIKLDKWLALLNCPFQRDAH